MSNSFYNKVKILGLIPRLPRKTNVSELHESLVNDGFSLTKRSIQRDLNSLAKLFPIGNDGNKDMPGWSWQRDVEKLEFPKMDLPVALTFGLVETYLTKFMPPHTLKQLDGYFKSAENLLNDLKNNSLVNWQDKISHSSLNQPLIAPEVDGDILDIVYKATLKEKQLSVHYLPNSKEPRDYIINPLGIVIVGKITYVVASLWDYPDVRQLALHRFKKVELLESSITIPNDFNFKNYVKQGNFEYFINDTIKFINIKLKINGWLIQHLEENKLDTEQKIHKRKGETFLTTKVKNTAQLRWWLQSLGGAVEIIKPDKLRREFMDLSENMFTLYHK